MIRENIYKNMLIQRKILALDRNQQLMSPKDTYIQNLRRGLRGLVNGFSVAAIADSGADGNFVTAAFAKKRSLKIEGPSNSFKLGNSTWIKSLGQFFSTFRNQTILHL